VPRSLSIIVLVLLVPIVPFMLFHLPMERWLAAVLAQPIHPRDLTLLVVGLLSADMVLPVPSSLLSTLAGSRLPAWWAALATWTGMNIGACVGFSVTRRWGVTQAQRARSAEDLVRLDRFQLRHAPLLLIMTRGLPLLAEATVLWLGLHGISWRVFLPPVLLSNLGIALAYSWLGHYAAAHHWLPMAMGIAVALPLAATIWLRRLLV
jgi:uncharacterized membrane protein YdjX (TVP38/TMEM64 family)